MTAEVTRFLVDVFHVGGTHHDTRVSAAVNEVERVSKFVDRFFAESIQEQLLVAGQAVDLVVEAEAGHDGRPSVKLRFPKDVGQYWNEQIHAGDTQNPRGAGGGVVEELTEQDAGIVLFAVRVEGQFRVKARQVLFHPQAEHVVERLGQAGQQFLLRTEVDGH